MLQNITTTITTVILHLYATTGLAGIVLAMSFESCLIPLPSEIVMPLAGVIIGSYYTNTSLKSLGVAGSLQMFGTSASLPLWVNLVLVALAGAVGCLIGSMVSYWIGHAGGRPLVLRYGRFILVSQHDMDVSDHFFERWGSPTAFFSRLLPVVRTYISLPAGITRMPFGKFCLYSFLGSLPWSLLLAFLGTLIGVNLDKISPYFHDFDIIILVLLVILLALYIWRHVRNDRKAREAHALEAAQPTSQQQNGWGQPQQQHHFLSHSKHGGSKISRKYSKHGANRANPLSLPSKMAGINHDHNQHNPQYNRNGVNQVNSDNSSNPGHKMGTIRLYVGVSLASKNIPMVSEFRHHGDIFTFYTPTNPLCQTSTAFLTFEI